MTSIQNSFNPNSSIYRDRIAPYLDQQQPNHFLHDLNQSYPQGISFNIPYMTHNQYVANQQNSNHQLAIHKGSQNYLNHIPQTQTNIEPQYPPLTGCAAFGCGLLTFLDVASALASFILFIYVLTFLPYFVNIPQVDSSGTVLLWVMIALYSIVILLRGVCHVFMGCASAGNCLQKIGLFASLYMPLLKYNIFRSIGNSVKTLVRPIYITDNISRFILLPCGWIGISAYIQLQYSQAIPTTQIPKTAWGCLFHRCSETISSSSHSYDTNNYDIRYMSFLGYLLAYSICAVIKAFLQMIGLAPYCHYTLTIIRLQNKLN